MHQRIRGLSTLRASDSHKETPPPHLQESKATVRTQSSSHITLRNHDTHQIEIALLQEWLLPEVPFAGELGEAVRRLLGDGVEDK